MGWVGIEVVDHVGRMLGRGWYAASVPSRQAVVGLLEHLAATGLELPLLGADMFGDVQCEWESAKGAVIVCTDRAGVHRLIVQRYGESDAIELANVSAEVVAAYVSDVTRTD